MVSWVWDVQKGGGHEGIYSCGRSRRKRKSYRFWFKRFEVELEPISGCLERSKCIGLEPKMWN